MEVLKGIFLAVWSIVGLFVLIAFFGMFVFVLGGGPQRMMKSLDPGKLFGGSLNGGPGQMQPFQPGLGDQSQNSGASQLGTGGTSQSGQPSNGSVQAQPTMPGSSQGGQSGTVAQPR